MSIPPLIDLPGGTSALQEEQPQEFMSRELFLEGPEKSLDGAPRQKKD